MAEGGALIDYLPSVRFRFTYQRVRQRAIRQPAEAQEREHLSGWLDDHPLTIAELQHPDQGLKCGGVYEGDPREVDQEVPDPRSHQGFGCLGFELTCRVKVNLAMDYNTLGSPVETPGARHGSGTLYTHTATDGRVIFARAWRNPAERPERVPPFGEGFGLPPSNREGLGTSPVSDQRKPHSL